MEKERHIKILSIITLVIAIAGMSLGFAAFSTTLNISSSASVTPNSDNFNIIFCNSINIGDCNSYVNHFLDYKTVNGATNGGTIADVMGTYASDLGASFTTTNQSIIYQLYVQNIGEYDAYLRGISYTSLDNGNYKKCTAATSDSTKATDTLVQAACEGIKVTVSVGGTPYELGSTNIFGHKLSKNSAEEVLFTIEYADGSTLVDGPFNVKIADIKLDYSTVDGISNLITFTIDGTTYQAEEGMTWAEWINSQYNVDKYILTAEQGVIKKSQGIEILTLNSIVVYSDSKIIGSENYIITAVGVERADE